MATRRDLMLTAAAFAGMAQPISALAKARDASLPAKAAPLPLSSVRLLPSEYATAVEVNRAYLLRLSPDRFLHNFMTFAGLPKPQDRANLLAYLNSKSDKPVDLPKS